MASFRRIFGSAIGAVDRAVLATIKIRGMRDRVSAGNNLRSDERIALLAEIQRDYGAAELLADPAKFFPTPSAIEPVLRHVRQATARTAVVDVTWASAFEPFLRSVAPRYLAHVENRTSRARLWLHDSGGKGAANRPVVIALHGYMGGHWAVEEAQWPMAWFLRRGFDVALPVLPFHGMRRGPRRGAPPFPSADARLTNEGFRQAVTDVAGLARWLRERGAPHVGVVGMSLGGYVAALLGTVSREIDFAMPVVPLASIADFAREQGMLGPSSAHATAEHGALEDANRVVSPIARPLLLPPSRALVVVAEHDRVTPSHHGQRIAAHWKCEMRTIPGGHLVQLGRSGVFRDFGAMLEKEGILPPRPLR